MGPFYLQGLCNSPLRQKDASRPPPVVLNCISGTKIDPRKISEKSKKVASSAIAGKLDFKYKASSWVAGLDQ
jgi:hypothetical protein